MRPDCNQSGALLRIFTALLLLVVAHGSAGAEARLALVIGNDDYANITRLKKAVNDANAVGEKLSGMGFEVTFATNVARRDMNRAIQNFVSAVKPGDVAMLFYAGHGIEIGGKNYLLPVDVPDADAGGAGFIEAESVALDDILERLRERDARLNIVVLDACRNNPFANGRTRGLGSRGGLARISAPQGTFVMYSADIGETALDRLGDDDSNPNSVFTRTLIPLMGRSDLDLVDTAREVRRQVRRLAQSVRHDQTPAYYDAVLGEFRFAEDDTVSRTSTATGDDGVQVASLPTETAGKDPVRDRLPDTTGRTPQEAAGRDEAGLSTRALVATGGEKDVIRLWDASTRTLVSELEGEKITISTLRFTANASRLLVATTDGGLFSYALPQFRKRNAIYPGFRVTAVSETKDGSLVIGGEDGTLALVDADTFTLRWQAAIHADIISPILVSADGKTAITASGDGTIAVTRLSDGELVSRMKTLPGKQITDIAFLGSSILIATHEDGTIAHVNFRSGRIITAFDAGHGWISSVDSVGDSAEYVTTGVDGVLSFWIAGSQSPLRQLQAHKDVASGAKFMRVGEGEVMISTGFDGSLKIWGQTGENLRADLDHGSAILHFDFHSGG